MKRERVLTLRLRLSANPPPSIEIERGLTDASVNFHKSGQLLTTASDGAKAFVGILAEVFAGDPQVLFIDEPEAFLHPSLAFNLGKEIATSLAASQKQLFASTHSPQFLMGCIQSGAPINVIRLTYRNGIATARMLANNDIISLMRNPLLRSANVISSLFYESVIVTEGDPDRAFYQEINERLIVEDRGAANCIFLNAQNKQTIGSILKPLRKLGIPAAGIYDIDIVKDGGITSTKFMDSIFIPKISRAGLNQSRSEIAAALANSNPGYKKEGGIKVLPKEERKAADDFLDTLQSYGAFVVRGGELESWLSHFDIGGHGPAWLIPMFEKMGEDPSSGAYARPETGDVWAFMDSVAAWLTDSRRKGLPHD